eukprot:1160692-Pelagomonas_calceolata.AAC.3
MHTSPLLQAAAYSCPSSHDGKPFRASEFLRDPSLAAAALKVSQSAVEWLQTEGSQVRKGCSHFPLREISASFAHMVIVGQAHTINLNAKDNELGRERS